MNIKRIKKQLDYQPTGLTEAQIQNPLKLMTYFFTDFPIHETRENLWELYKGWIHHSSQYVDETQTKDMLCFYNQFTEFVNACYVYSEMKKHKIQKSNEWLRKTIP